MPCAYLKLLRGRRQFNKRKKRERHDCVHSYCTLHGTEQHEAEIDHINGHAQSILSYVRQYKYQVIRSIHSVSVSLDKGVECRHAH